MRAAPSSVSGAGQGMLLPDPPEELRLMCGISTQRKSSLVSSLTMLCSRYLLMFQEATFKARCSAQPVQSLTLPTHYGLQAPGGNSNGHFCWSYPIFQGLYTYLTSFQMQATTFPFLQDFPASTSPGGWPEISDHGCKGSFCYGSRRNILMKMVLDKSREVTGRNREIHSWSEHQGPRAIHRRSSLSLLWSNNQKSEQTERK